jgi:predicted tellurium resistance membrane protein TerC
MCNAYGSDELAPLDDWHDIGIGHPSQHLTVRRGAGFRKSAQVGSQGALPSSKGTSVHYKQAITATVWSIVATIVFGLGVVWPWKGSGATVDFATAFLVEKSLSVDNLFVFLMIFEYFKVPEAHTQRVLKWGILTALLLRGVMIGLGVAVVTRFRPVLLLFALILIVSSYKMLQPEEDSDLADNPVMKIARRLVKATDNYDGDRFFTRERGVRRATPMLVVLVCIELSDVVFAVDSIPAVVGISQARDTHHASHHHASHHHASHTMAPTPGPKQDPFVVYTSNCFALLALRSLYTLLAKSVQQLHYLRHAVALILGFVGVKMTLEFFHFEVAHSTCYAHSVYYAHCASCAYFADGAPLPTRRVPLRSRWVASSR